MGPQLAFEAKWLEPPSLATTEIAGWTAWAAVGPLICCRSCQQQNYWRAGCRRRLGQRHFQDLHNTVGNESWAVLAPDHCAALALLYLNCNLGPTDIFTARQEAKLCQEQLRTSRLLPTMQELKAHSSRCTFKIAALNDPICEESNHNSLRQPGPRLLCCQ